MRSFASLRMTAGDARRPAPLSPPCAPRAPLRPGARESSDRLRAVGGEVDDEPRGDTLGARDHALGDVVPTHHDGELVSRRLATETSAVRPALPTIRRSGAGWRRACPDREVCGGFR